MRIGRKFLALTGLCALALTCLIALADNGPAPELAGNESPPVPKAGSAEPKNEPSPEPKGKRKSPQPEVVEFPRDLWEAEGKSQPVPPAPKPPEDSDVPPLQPEFDEDFDNAEDQVAQSPGDPSAVPPLPPKQQPAPSNGDGIPLDFTGGSSESVKVINVNNSKSSSKKPAGTSVAELTGAASYDAAVDASVKPTTGPQTAQMSLEWVRRTEINVGQECRCDLVVKNAGKIPARNVVVKAAFPSSARLLPATKPAPTPAGNQLQWNLGKLAPEQSKIIEVHLIPTTREELNASAFVHFTSAAATVFPVQEPLLEVALKGPKEVQVGDPASQIIQVSNPGTGTARNVEIKALIPAGLEHPQGKQLSMAIGSLNAGETRMIRLALSAESGGDHEIKVLAEAKLSPGDAPYLRKLSETKIRVISPSVKVVAQGPGLRYKNRNATYKISVTNDGTAVSNNVRVMHKVPEGFRFVSATDGGKFDAISKTVAWFVGRVEPGQSSEISITLEAEELGDFEHQISAITDQGARSEDRIPTKVDGIASLALEVNDQNDPVEVGVETAYEIHVKNQGTKHAQNVSVACELPAGVELVDVEASAKHNLQGRVLVFESRPSLAAEKDAVYRVIVKGQSDGFHRFRARLSSDSIQEPLIVEELTRFYGE